ncbi:endonuclease/exonuclease/phosphatase family protein [uncultured Microbacterium sp.]|uniref:endonuclease/exonuclease/phosphatase family protein n=1 Tax=uncultured Microbacterium sp. TaxID=191216 RepID=UPI0028DBC50B|nr:endonuclease/exonuclease/phosphatase family protein [uncultured Microbacterium sp.]
MTATAPPLLGPPGRDDLHVMTFNVRRAMEGPLVRRHDRWSHRAPAVAALLRTERPAVLGLQEVRPRILPVLRDALGPGYRRIGRGRDANGGGEGNPLFFNEQRLSLRDSGQDALSPHPDVPGSLGWGGLFPRTAVWGAFDDRITGARFLAVCTHLDPFSPRSRRRSATALRTLVHRHRLPAVVMGDLNAGVDAPAVRALLAGGMLRDAWAAAEHRATPAWGTFPDYRAPRENGRRIDLVAVTPGIRVRAAGIDARRFEGRTPSDHLAVHTLLHLAGREDPHEGRLPPAAPHPR